MGPNSRMAHSSQPGLYLTIRRPIISTEHHGIETCGTIQAVPLFPWIQSSKMKALKSAIIQATIVSIQKTIGTLDTEYWAVLDKSAVSNITIILTTHSVHGSIKPVDFPALLVCDKALRRLVIKKISQFSFAAITTTLYNLSLFPPPSTIKI